VKDELQVSHAEDPNEAKCLPYQSNSPVAFGTTPYTAQEAYQIGAQLAIPLAKKDVKTRPGPGGKPLTYIEGWRAIDIANSIFGFDGWSSQLVSLDVRSCRQAANKRWHACVMATMRITLRNGTFHEDRGGGIAENKKTEEEAQMAAEKEAITDACKRALKNFGRRLGLSLYSDEHLRILNSTPIATQNPARNVSNTPSSNTSGPMAHATREMPHPPHIRPPQRTPQTPSCQRQQVRQHTNDMGHNQRQQLRGPQVRAVQVIDPQHYAQRLDVAEPMQRSLQTLGKREQLHQVNNPVQEGPILSKQDGSILSNHPGMLEPMQRPLTCQSKRQHSEAKLTELPGENHQQNVTRQEPPQTAHPCYPLDQKLQQEARPHQREQIRQCQRLQPMQRHGPLLRQESEQHRQPLQSINHRPVPYNQAESHRLVSTNYQQSRRPNLQHQPPGLQKLADQFDNQGKPQSVSSDFQRQSPVQGTSISLPKSNPVDQGRNLQRPSPDSNGPKYQPQNNIEQQTKTEQDFSLRQGQVPKTAGDQPDPYILHSRRLGGRNTSPVTPGMAKGNSVNPEEPFANVRTCDRENGTISFAATVNGSPEAPKSVLGTKRALCATDKQVLPQPGSLQICAGYDLPSNECSVAAEPHSKVARFENVHQNNAQPPAVANAAISPVGQTLNRTPFENPLQTVHHSDKIRDLSRQDVSFGLTPAVESLQAGNGQYVTGDREKKEVEELCAIWASDMG
jgi:DNA recombination protein Rad52